MHKDDRPVGRLLSRREFLALFGTALLAGCLPETAATPQPATDVPASQPATDAPTSAPATAASIPATPTTVAVPACVVRPEMTEGPYFVDEMLDRSDIRSDPGDGSLREGLPLQLTFVVSQVGSGSCTALEGAMVDVWHCDALGVYSGVSDPGFDTSESNFLRGYQVTAADGVASFTTIYPGWYPGRTVHIHFKIRGNTATGQAYEFTSQLFFDDTLSDQVFAQEPYAGRGERSPRNEGDGIYRNGGEQLTLQLTSVEQGYAATFPIGLQL
jgi:protocatechuate 3,4-dioxygenase beta subunit